jgi:hypothetical protein
MSDMTGIRELNEFISRTTIAYRKGAEVTVEDRDGITVVHVVGYPETPSRGVLVDVHFLNIGFTEAIAGTTAREFLDLVTVAEHGEFADMPLDTIKGGPSYISYGGWLGSQDQALRFLALGEYYRLWKVITPGVMHIEGAQADSLAGSGFVMNGGLKEPQE